MKHFACNLATKAYEIGSYATKHKQQILFITTNTDAALTLAAQLRVLFPALKVNYIAEQDALPYDRTASTISASANKIEALLSSKESNVVITTVRNLCTKLPPHSALHSAIIKLQVGTLINFAELAKQLVELGFIKTSVANDPGEFAVRGEIIDIATNNIAGYRICTAFGAIESIRLFDLNSQLSSKTTEHVTIYPVQEVLFTEETKQLFRQNYLKHFGVNSEQTGLLEQILAGQKLGYREQLMPLFYSSVANIFDYISASTVIIDHLYEQAISELEHNIEDFYQTRIENNKLTEFYPAIAPEAKYFSLAEVKQSLPAQTMIVEYGGDETKSATAAPDFVQMAAEKRTPSIELFAEFLRKSKIAVIVAASSSAGLERIKMLLEQQQSTAQPYIYRQISTPLEALPRTINLLEAPIKQGFATEHYVIIGEQDLFGSKISVTKPQTPRKHLKDLLTEVNNFSVGEKVVHKQHGIAIFAGLETLEVQKVKHDCIKLIYAGDDKLFIPVENIDHIAKYGENDAQLDKLGGISWQKRQARLKERIGELAKKLINIAAMRKLARPIEHHIDLKLYDEFCDSFPYVETEDQLASAEAIKEDLLTGKVIDRLICGDVGFGKTEIAMRAAFLVSAASMPRRQTAIISPTTILCKQHYNSFIERFSKFGLRIEQISRFVPQAKINQIKQELALGKIDILIGTHAILSNDIKFADLGLVIIDEEQHFGVSQKEKLKELKQDIHVISMSATPIPRSLQMSLVGIKDLSIIATPPVDRLPVKTNIITYDPIIIRDALMREHYRGGNSFFVCPRISDLEIVEAELKMLVPELKYEVAHGRMAATTLDTITSDFYQGKFDILLSTTIIESGVDIPSANTIIIYRADMLGLSQLYQLRGRVGRGKMRGNAYLTLHPKHISEVSRKRLSVLQNLEELGAGFTIASHDMDMRGFGNIVGEEQSGQIKEVGIELYHDMLEEALNALQPNAEEKNELSPILNLGINVFIPSEYIEDNDLRLSCYRKFASARTDDEIAALRSEMLDRFGDLPQEVINLTQIISLKLVCKKLRITQIDSGPSGLSLKFADMNEQIQQAVMHLVQAFPRITKLKPDNKLVILQALEQKNILAELAKWLERISPC